MRNKLLKTSSFTIFSIIADKAIDISILYIFYFIGCILVPLFPIYPVIVFYNQNHSNLTTVMKKLGFIFIVPFLIFSYVVYYCLFFLYACFIQSFKNFSNIKGKIKKKKRKMLSPRVFKFSESSIYKPNENLDNIKMLKFPKINKTNLSLVPEDPNEISREKY